MKLFLKNEQFGYKTKEGNMWPLAVVNGVSAIRIDMPQGLDVHRHSHGRDCMLFLLKGSVEFDDGEKILMQKGDVATYSGEEEIGFKALEESSVLFVSLGDENRDFVGLITMFENLGLEVVKEH